MRTLRVLLATLVLAVGLMVPELTRPAAARAAEPEALVSITLDSIDPALPQRDGTITITGRVTNTSKKRLYRLRAYFWRNQAPVTDREGFDQALDSASNEPLGARDVRSVVDLFKPGDPYLSRGASATFTLQVKVSELALSPSQGLYLMGVHVLQSGSPFAVGRARVFVPVLDHPPRNTLLRTSIVVMNSKPSLVRKGVFADEHLAKEIGDGGRLQALIEAANQSDVSYAVDPSLVEDVQTMKGGYQVLGSDGKTVAGIGQSAATRWLSEFQSLESDRDGYRLLYGSVDIAALTHQGQSAIIQRSETASKTVEATASLPLLIWPGGGTADADTVSVAEALKPRAILLSDASAKGSGPLLQGPGPAPLVSYTSTAFGGGPGPEPSDTAVHLQQRLLAETWIEATGAPAGSTLGRVRVISTAAQAQGDDENVKAPWIKRSTLSQLLASAPTTWSNEFRYTERARAKELSSQQVGTLNRLKRTFDTFEDVLVDPSSVQAAESAALARAASVRWRRTDATFRALVNPQQSDLEGQLDKIKISATPRVITPKSRVSFPITIRNTLPPSTNPAEPNTNAVKVKLVFSSANSQRLTVQPIGLTSIQAGQNFTTNAIVEAKTNGTVRVTAQLTTDSGRPIGTPFNIDVHATQAGTVGWLIAFAAGLVLLGTTALRIRQVARERAKQGPSAIDLQGGALTSAPVEDTSESIDV